MFSFVKSCVVKKWPKEGEIKFASISGLFFLRMVCPGLNSMKRISHSKAILGPRQFNLMPEHPKELPARNLTLISKTRKNLKIIFNTIVMSLANLVEFGQKEPYMKDMNQFITQNMNEMRIFLDLISVSMT